ncbi:MAG: hypothetical protein AABX29_06335 [Nanoarchaeota archaeon]
MEKNKVFIGIAAIVLIALIGFNFSGITGNVVGGSAPDVTAFPGTVKAGEKINIKVKPNNGCVDPEVGFYFSGRLSDGSITSSGGRKGVVTQKGGYKVCKRDNLILDKDGTFTVGYRTEPGWDGEHFAKIFYWKNRDTKDSINIYFNVLPKEE